MCTEPHKYSFAWKEDPGSARSGVFPLGEALPWAGHFHSQLPCSCWERAGSQQQ